MPVRIPDDLADRLLSALTSRAPVTPICHGPGCRLMASGWYCSTTCRRAAHAARRATRRRAARHGAVLALIAVILVIMLIGWSGGVGGAR